MSGLSARVAKLGAKCNRENSVQRVSEWEAKRERRSTIATRSNGLHLGLYCHIQQENHKTDGKTEGAEGGEMIADPRKVIAFDTLGVDRERCKTS